MANFDIGISGLSSAQLALEVLGNNIANAGTEGYHRQRAELTPAIETYEGGVLIGQGVQVADVTRLYSTLVEAELTKQNSNLAMANRLQDTLKTVETAFGELASEGLSSAMDNYFESMSELSTDPNNAVLQNKVLRSAEQLTYEFRRMGTFLSELEEQLTLEAKKNTNEVNIIGEQIARLNGDIQRVELGGGTAGNMRDERDKLINDLSELVDVTVSDVGGMKNVVVAQTPLVIGTKTTPMKADLYRDGDQVKLGLAPEGTHAYSSHITGGQIGAVIKLKDELIADIHNKLDTLAKTVITETNKLHIQGVGAEGAFSNLTGWVLNSEDLSTFEPPVQSGTIYVKVTDSAGVAKRYAIDVDPAVDTLSDVADKFNAISGFSGCGVIGSKLVLQSDMGYEFDFQAGVPPQIELGTPPINTGPADSKPEVSGTYTGKVDHTYICTVVGDGGVGMEGGPKVNVTNELGQTIATFDLGEGYEKGSRLFIDDGVYVSFSEGQLNDGGVFTIDNLACSDTSGLLAATGINCLFSGYNAGTMGLRSDIESNPERLAVAGGGEQTDGSIIKLMSEVGEVDYDSLFGLAPEKFYQNLAADIGQEVEAAKLKTENANNIMKHLSQQRDDISGVDINTEATQLLVYERMFQAMSKYINTVSNTMDSLLGMIQ